MTGNAEIYIWMTVAAKRVEARTGVDILDLLSVSYGRVVEKETKRLGCFNPDLYPAAQLNHIIDWLVSAMQRNEEWLSRLDDEGRPKKLMKMGTIPQMVAEANKAMKKRRNDGAALVASEGAELVHDCGNGYGVFKLTTEEALDHEGFEMGHCVGQGAYDRGVADGRIAIFSIRDRFGKSHVTVEIDLERKTVLQIKGKQNELPKAEYMRQLVGWLDPSFKIDEEDLPPGFAVDYNNRLFDLSALKPGEVFEGDLLFRSLDDEPDEYRVPIADGVVIRGYVSVVGADLLRRMKLGKGDEYGVLQRVVLPQGLKVEGGLELKYLRLHADELEIDGSLNMSVCEVTKLPKRVTAYNCTFRRTIFDGVSGTAFGSTVTFHDCNNAVLENMVFEKAVTVRDCSTGGAVLRSAVTFGDGTLFRGDLTVKDSEIGFAGTITCEDMVRLRSCREVRMPDTMTVDGSFYALDCQIDRWPPQFEVTGECAIADSNVASERVNTVPARKFG
ncbi:hypothetical protein HFN89_01310 [Rhizobium laguerreae]|nr:hypothetical protein [Rhizobium laguerreae]